MALTDLSSVVRRPVFDPTPIILVIGVLLAMLGGAMMGLYTMGLILLGERFRGIDLGSATTLFQVMWNVGMVTGPFAVGAAMDVAGASALPWTLVATYIVVIGFTALRGRRHHDP